MKILSPSSILKTGLAFCLLLECFLSYGAIHYVNNASDISTAMSTALPGDVLIMTDGIWNNENIQMIGNGTATNPIVLRPQSPGGVSLEGNSTLEFSGSYLEVNGLVFQNGYITSGSVISFRTSTSDFCHNCRLTNTAIINYNNPATPTSSNGYKWVSLYGTNNRVDHCYLEGKNNEGATLTIWTDATPDYHLIEHNHFYLRPELGFNGGESMRCGDSANAQFDSFSTIEYNLFEECDGEVEVISNKSGSNTFRYNTFLRSKGSLVLRHGNGSEVYSNYFLGDYGKPGCGGVRVIGEQHKIYNNYFENLHDDNSGFRTALSIMNGESSPPANGRQPVRDIQVVNNTFVQCKTSVLMGAEASGTYDVPPENIEIYNNIFYSTRGDDNLINYDDIAVNLTYGSNVAFGDPLGIALPPGISITDPLMSQLPGDLFRPASTNVIDAGDNSFHSVLYLDDVEGQQRNDGFVDIGADEESTDAVLNPVLTTSDVGAFSSLSACSITDVQVQNISCNDQGTPEINDDTISFEIVVNATDGSAAGWFADDVDSSTGQYDLALLLGPYMVSDGLLQFNIFDFDNPNCTFLFSIDLMETCHPSPCGSPCFDISVSSN